MGQIILNIDDNLKDSFKNKIGYGNMSEYIITSIKSFVEEGATKTPKKEELDYKIALKNIQLINPQIEDTKKYLERLQTQLGEWEIKRNEIENKRRQREIAELQAQKAEEEQRKKDSLADLKRKQDFVDAYMRAGQQ